MKESNYEKVVFRNTLFQKQDSQISEKYKNHKKFCSSL